MIIHDLIELLKLLNSMDEIYPPITPAQLLEEGVQQGLTKAEELEINEIEKPLITTDNELLGKH